mmetsp:Transcript_15495/g.60604  ORF Transcript_15495/g.60604 Transcript_15495/m.60604 type:complete len:339 (-) Transcript_15495:996-2012(-)
MGGIDIAAVPQQAQFFLAAGLIYVCYGLSGFILETVTSARFEVEGQPGEEEFYQFTFFTLFVQVICSAVLSKSVIALFALPANTAPAKSYMLVSATFIAAQFFSFHALLYVSYPTQVLAKSCKPIPVMLMGIVVMKKHYPIAKYLFVTLMCCGIILFSYNPNKSTGDSSLYGYSLLILSLAFDGVTGPFQEKLVKAYHPSSNQMMFFSNLWASVFMAVALLLTGQLYPAVSFCLRHPEMMQNLILFGMCNAVGQHAIYFLVRNFGALVLSMTTTSRKFFTILLSIVWFGHPVTPQQWAGVSMVFTGLALDSVWSKRRPAPSKPQPVLPVVDRDSKEDV